MSLAGSCQAQTPSGFRVIVPRGVLWALARHVPEDITELDRIPGLGPWRRAEYGAELLDVLARVNGDK